MQRRIHSQANKFETRDINGELHISGYFAVFNSMYEIWDGAVESIAPTAFDGALNDDIRCLIDHDTRLVLGRTTAGTFTLRVDEKGLFGDVVINPDDQDAMNLYARVQRGDVNQCSFGFDILGEEFEEINGIAHWTITAVKLYECSVVTFPAYEETSVEARKKDYQNQLNHKLQHDKAKILKILRKGE